MTIPSSTPPEPRAVEPSTALSVPAGLLMFPPTWGVIGVVLVIAWLVSLAVGTLAPLEWTVKALLVVLGIGAASFVLASTDLLLRQRDEDRDLAEAERRWVAAELDPVIRAATTADARADELESSSPRQPRSGRSISV